MTVVGARPQFIKAAVVSRRLRDSRFAHIQESIVHTGQHYDDNMSDAFFRELGIPEPAVNLGVGSLPHGAQTGAIMAGLERIMTNLQPDLVLVYGDTNSTLAAALVAAKSTALLAHVEAGLRSHRRAMPEEVNRVVTDHLSDHLFCPTDAARVELRREGVVAGVHVVGDVMYDSFLYHRDKAQIDPFLSQHGLARRRYIFATAHRAENTDDPRRLAALLAGLGDAARDIQIALALHPRTRDIIAKHGLRLPTGIVVLEPQPYIRTIGLLSAAAVVATDSGGLQKEAFFAGVPCVTLREETEWIETLSDGWNRLAPPGDGDIGTALRSAAGLPRDKPPPQLFGDGDAAARILEALS